MGFKSLNKYILLFWLVLYLRKVNGINEFCPVYCKCYVWNTDMRRADCINQNLFNIETEVDKNVEVLDLSNNSITTLTNRGFQILGLTNLKYIILQHNKISAIDLYAFTGLNDLQKLDLSHNHLNYLLPGTFHDTPVLRALHLSHNKLAKLSPGPLLEIPSLKELDISSCQLGNILDGFFNQLSSIRRLNLSDNQLTKINIHTLAPLTELRDIDLANNPWSCNQVKTGLQHWLHKQDIKDTTNCVKEEKFAKIITAVNKTESESMEEDIQTFWFEKDDKEDLEDGVKIVVVNEVPSGLKTFYETMEKIPSVWAMLIGFEVGVVLTTVTMYLWLKKPSTMQRHSTRPTSQSSEILWTELDTDVPPETPPPPYRSRINTYRAC